MPSNKLRAVVFATTVSSLAGWSSVAAAQNAQGFYTKEQATRGEALYVANCSECHGRQLQGNDAPALVGRDVMGSWITAQGLFDYISVAMPPSNPGNLGEPAYVEIIAHILATNGAASGSKPLALAEMPNVDLMKSTAVAAAPASAPAQAAAPAAAAPRLPQAFTAGRTLPVTGAPGAAPPTPAAPAAPRLPQAFTAGKQLPTAGATSAAPPLPGPGATR